MQGGDLTRSPRPLHFGLEEIHTRKSDPSQQEEISIRQRVLWQFTTSLQRITSRAVITHRRGKYRPLLKLPNPFANPSDNSDLSFVSFLSSCKDNSDGMKRLDRIVLRLFACKENSDKNEVFDRIVSGVICV